MILEGVVTNVANFGAFVDIGVHQDGLVHISAIADKFVKDPRTVVKAGDVVKVKVLEVDLPRQRIALTMRLADELPGTAESRRPHRLRQGPPAPAKPATTEQRHGQRLCPPETLTAVTAESLPRQADQQQPIKP
jgi:uncharacterized protein